MRWLPTFLIGLMGLGAEMALEAAPIQIIKVLPHFLDREGRQSLSPSLYDRDAYQAFLRQHPTNCSALRFDIQWKARAVDPTRLKLRLELRGSRTHTTSPFVLEQPVKPRRFFSSWSALTLEASTYETLGRIIAWRVTLWEGDQLLAENKSFFW